MCILHNSNKSCIVIFNLVILFVFKHSQQRRLRVERRFSGIHLDFCGRRCTYIQCEMKAVLKINKGRNKKHNRVSFWGARARRRRRRIITRARDYD